jgi:hypothetical protein
VVICKTPINNQEILVFSLSRVEGATFLDIRIFQKIEGPEGRLTPTNKTASYPIGTLEQARGTYTYLVDQATAILKGLGEAEKFLTERGILQAPELNPLLREFTKAQGWK